MPEAQQQGTIRLDVFDQGKTWTTNDGRTVEIATMDPGHRQNLIAFLRRKAPVIGPSWARYAQVAGRSLLDVDDPSDGVWSAQVQLQSQIQEALLEPSAWLEQTPLMRALVAADKANPHAEPDFGDDPWKGHQQ